MLRVRSAFASFSVDDLGAARTFYGDKLGFEIRETEMGVIEVVLGSDQQVTIYPKPNHEPASFTVLNFVVPDIDEAVEDLAGMGIAMERYDMPEMQQDEKGVARDPQGPAIAWFRDPAGNILAVIGEG